MLKLYLNVYNRVFSFYCINKCLVRTKVVSECLYCDSRKGIFWREDYCWF